MSLVGIKNDELELFKRILKDRYVIEDGSVTNRIVREFKRVGVPIDHGYSQATKRVIVALEQSIRAKQRRRTSNKTFFELQF